MNIRDFALIALFIALVAVATMIIRVPIPQTNGYMNLGDSIVLLGGVFFGPVMGFMVGGLGSALADILGGYPQWALWTLIIKGVEASLAAILISILKLDRDNLKPIVIFGFIICFFVATVWMVAGYYIAETIMYDQKAALAELPANLLQAGGSIVLAIFMLPLFHKIIKPIKDKAGIQPR